MFSLFDNGVFYSTVLLSVTAHSILHRLFETTAANNVRAVAILQNQQDLERECDAVTAFSFVQYV